MRIVIKKTGDIVDLQYKEAKKLIDSGVATYQNKMMITKERDERQIEGNWKNKLQTLRQKR